VAAIPGPALERRRGEGTWTIYEHLLHLVETQEVILARLELIRDQARPVITPYAPKRLEPGSGRPSAQDLVGQFARWGARRDALRPHRGSVDHEGRGPDPALGTL
jgi:hypothetical protein